MAKKPFLTGSLILNSVTYGLTAINVTETTDTPDVTDLSDDNYYAHDPTYQPVGATKMDISADLWRDFAKAEPVSRTKYAATLTIETDVYSGFIYLVSITKNGTHDTVIRYSMSGHFTGKLNAKPS